MSDRATAHQALRAGTRDQHERLDALMSRYDLGDAASYRDFLSAHAMALPAVETALDEAGFAARLEDWPQRRRAHALADDLATLGADMPVPLVAPALDDAAAQWGAAYVIEGSRLGGAFLARQLGEGFPKSYLGTPQPAGNWRRFLSDLDKAVSLRRDVEQAQAAARAVFALFEEAARRHMEKP